MVKQFAITVDAAKISWTASSSLDLASSPYTFEWGTSITYGSSSGALLQTTKFYNIIGLVCKEKWSSGIIKIFKLPGTSGLTIY